MPTLLIYLAGLAFLGEAPGTNPITDSHWSEALLRIISAVTVAGNTLGISKWWAGKAGNSWLR